MGIISLENKRVERGVDYNRTDRICFDDCIATYFGFIEMDYHGIYVDALDFSYNKATDFTDNSLCTVDFKREIYKKYGIQYNEVFGSKDDSMKYISESIRRKVPVIVRCDAYWLPWDDYAYKKHNIEGHAYFIVGIGEGCYICNDPYLKKHNVLLTHKDFYEGFACYGSFEVKKNIKEYNLIKETIKRIKIYIGNKNAMYEFFRQLCVDIQLEDIIGDNKHSYDENWLYKSIEKLRDNRIRFNSIFKYIAIKENNTKIRDLSNEYDKVIKCWGILLSVIVKTAITRNINYLHKIMQDDFNVIIDQEIHILDNLLHELS